MNTPGQSQSISLADGRRLAWHEYGASDGTPVIYCHGFPGSRLDGALVEKAAREVGVRLIAADRPGFGQSDFQPDRNIEDWPADLAALADHLGIDRFPVLGVSGGGPYALAAALHLPERVSRLGLVCALGSLTETDATDGMSPAQSAVIETARHLPQVARHLNTWLTGPFLRTFPASALSILTATAPEADRKILSDPKVRETLLATTREALHDGGRGAAWELYQFTQGPAVDTAAIRVPTLLWHGEADTTVPVAMGRRHAALIPGCRARFLPEEGHFSLPIRHAREIFQALVAA